MENVKERLEAFLRFQIYSENFEFQVLETVQNSNYERQLLSYIGNENDEIRAYLFIPKNQKIIGSVLVHHQHNGERHWGKSEAAGIVGDPWMHFCPALAEKGIACLAPDSICFEDRRTNQKGTEATANEMDDWIQHYNQMCYRLLKGKRLMNKVIADSSQALSLLCHLNLSSPENVGILGHSYGGNTVLFHSPFDDRIKFSCSSGAVCSFANKFENGTGIEMAEVIPDFSIQFDVPDLIEAVGDRKFLIVAACGDQYSKDAKSIYETLLNRQLNNDQNPSVFLKEFDGGHALTKERFDYIIKWFVNNFKESSSCELKR